MGISDERRKKRKKYQTFERLSDAEFSMLEASILERGIQHPIIFDTLGNILDGHHRYEIATKHGLDYPSEEKKGLSHAEKKAYVIEMNLGRRHISAEGSGGFLKEYIKVKGVKRGKGANQHTRASLTMSDAALELGMPESTMRRHMKLHDEKEDKEKEEPVPKKKPPKKKQIEDFLIIKVSPITRNFDGVSRIAVTLGKHIQTVTREEAVDLLEQLGCAIERLSA